MERLGCIQGRARIAALMLASLALAGCQRETVRPADEEQTEVFARSDELPVFTLQPISAEEIGDFDLTGDKQCRFAASPVAQPLVLATGYLRRPRARVDVLVKYGDQVVPAGAEIAGGFDAVREGGTFDSGGMIVDVARITLEPDGSGPAAPNRALLRIRMAGQEEQIVEGYWICTV